MGIVIPFGFLIIFVEGVNLGNRFAGLIAGRLRSY